MLRLCSQRLLRRRPTFSPAIVGLRALRVVGVGRSKPMTKKAAAVAEPANVLERSSSAPNVAEARKVEPANESLVEAPPITMDEFRNSLTDWQPRNLDPSLLANAGCDFFLFVVQASWLLCGAVSLRVFDRDAMCSCRWRAYCQLCVPLYRFFFPAFFARTN